MSGQGKQAKILSEAQIRAALGQVEHSRYRDRDRAMILLSVKAGLRAKEIASLTWGMVTDAEGAIGDAIHLTNSASKGKHGSRTIPLNAALREALMNLKAVREDDAQPTKRIIHSERGEGYGAASVQVWFARLYGKLGFTGASSHAAGAPLSLERQGRSSRQAVACEMCKSWPAMRVWPPRSGISPATPTPSAK